MSKDSASKPPEHLGDFKVPMKKFEHLAQVLTALQGKEFHKLNDQQRAERVSRTLYELIKKTPTPCFLLPAVVEFIEQIHALKILDSYAFVHFELWLNQFSSLSQEENALVRAKIVGKWIPRDAYQILFPIGMGKVYPGSHFVTAHGSPDLDTTIASFWGWVDAFGARVASGLHLWNIPGGAPTSQIEIRLFFSEIFGASVFNLLAKTRTALALSGIDLMTQQGYICTQKDRSTQLIDHENSRHAVVLVDEEGYYLGDWRYFDVEGVRHIIMTLNSALRWFENQLHVQLIALFAKEGVVRADLSRFMADVLEAKLSDWKPMRELTSRHKHHLHDYLSKVLHVHSGLDCTFEEFGRAMQNLSLTGFREFEHLARSVEHLSLFNSAGALTGSRTEILQYLEQVMRALDLAIQSMCTFDQRLEVALNIKASVFGHVPQSISYRADVDEIKLKLGSHSYLCVTATDKEGRQIPMGVVHSHDLHKPVLGTVTLRDFCNRDETKIPSYLEVISVIDHHKSSLQTSSAPMAIIADTQSSNVLCAEMAFAINDRYATSGMSGGQIDRQIDALQDSLSSRPQTRMMTRLLQHKLAVDNPEGFFVDPDREYLEYLHFLYGIFDDTDLLTKMSQRDVECVVQLINRLKSLVLKTQVEVISLDDLPRSGDFVKKACMRILQNADVYSLYRKIYLAKEEAVSESIVRCIRGEESIFFADTKEQNGCARVGQAKLFARNYPAYVGHCALLRKHWYDKCLEYYHAHRGIDLHMQMISTIAGAEDLFAGSEGSYAHQDELWIWISGTEQSIEHLKEFLGAFRACPQVSKEELSVEFHGDKAKVYEQIFAESFRQVSAKTISERAALPIAVLKYRAGLLNSRKAMISPYLPKPAG